jgi:hypothetical protein
VLHHASLGVGKFYVFDTQSGEPMGPVLDDLVASGLVAYTYVTNTSAELELQPPPEGRSYNWQVPIFELCLQRHGAAHRWMGFIDADEFVVPTDPGGSGGGDGGDGGGGGYPGGADGGALPALLRRHEAHAGLLLHWRLFSFDGHVDRPRGGVLASYTACWPRGAGIHRHVKSFVQPALVEGPETPHSFFYKQGQHSVNTEGRRVQGPIVRKGVVRRRAARRSLAPRRPAPLMLLGRGPNHLLWPVRPCTPPSTPTALLPHRVLCSACAAAAAGHVPPCRTAPLHLQVAGRL